MEQVAVIGAGPGGIAAARWLKKEGFDPVVFEQGDRLGGQWAGCGAPYSGVWPSMRTNTSRVMTAFSDLDHAAGTPVYPTNGAVYDYLHRYADQFDLLPCLRTRRTVHEVSRADSGWAVRFANGDGNLREVIYPRAVIASGRFNKPKIPDVPGLESFSGRGGVAHTFSYKEPERYRGLRVLVAGCSISALEIASDVAMLGAARVLSSNRRQRYVVQKMLAGVPTDHLAFTRFSALAGEAMPPEATAQNMKDFIVGSYGSPEQFGAAKPADNVFEAGTAMSQHFMPLVAEGRIEMKRWLTGVDGQKVKFADGSEEEVDAILFGTGFYLDLPFLGEDIRRTTALDNTHIDLHKFTFHPDLPGLAFAGIMEIVGPNFPLLELQARWIAYTWSGALPTPSREEMEAGIAAQRARRAMPFPMPMHVAALLFARAAGVEPELQRWPELARALLFGPLTPISFRLDGRDSLPDAPRRTAQAAAEFGAVSTPEFSPPQAAMLRGLAVARGEVPEETGVRSS